MTGASYNYSHDELNQNLYFFWSEGDKGRILKAVIFSKIEDNRWNLGFGDWHQGFINHAIVSNNQDVRQIIATVIEIASAFLTTHPERILYIDPVDDKRKQLYNHILRRHFDVFSLLYNITGFKEKTPFEYNPNDSYDSFEIQLKF